MSSLLQVFYSDFANWMSLSYFLIDINLHWHNLIVSPVFALFSGIHVLLVLIYNLPGLIQDSKPDPLPLKSGSITTVSCTFHIYSHNYSSSNIIFQTTEHKIIKPWKHCMILLQIESKCYYKLRPKILQFHQKFITIYGTTNLPKLLMVITNFQNYYRLDQKLWQITASITISVITNCVIILYCFT